VVKDRVLKDYKKSSFYKFFFDSFKKDNPLNSQAMISFRKFLDTHGFDYVRKGNLVFAYMGNTEEWYENTLENSKDILKRHHLPNDTIEDLMEYFAMNDVYNMWVSQAKLRSLLIRAVAIPDTSGDIFKSILSQAGSKSNTLSRSNVAVYLKDPELAKVNNNKFQDALIKAIEANKIVT
jgi:hypothetical protein